MSTLILLPGMDGTGTLFGSLIDILPAEMQPMVISYPPDKVCSYDELLQRIEGQLHDKSDLILVGESFSGPLAIRYAARHASQVRALVLCASFVTSPVSTWLRFLVGAWPFRVPMPSFHTRHYLTGKESPDSLVRAVHTATRSVAPEVLADRVKEIIRTDVSAELQQCSMPILYLRAMQDRVVPPVQAQKIRAIQPNAVIADVDGPHLLLQTEPVAAWKTICDFLTAHGIG